MHILFERIYAANCLSPTGIALYISNLKSANVGVRFCCQIGGAWSQQTLQFVNDNTIPPKVAYEPYSVQDMLAYK